MDPFNHAAMRHLLVPDALRCAQAMLADLDPREIDRARGRILELNLPIGIVKGLRSLQRSRQLATTTCRAVIG